LAASFAAAGGNGSLCLAAIVLGAVASARGAEVQYQIPAIMTAATTLASIRPNALRIATLPTNATLQTSVRRTRQNEMRTFAPGH
jgi:hypothetical protein